MQKNEKQVQVTSFAHFFSLADTSDTKLPHMKLNSYNSKTGYCSQWIFDLSRILEQLALDSFLTTIINGIMKTSIL